MAAASVSSFVDARAAGDTVRAVTPAAWAWLHCASCGQKKLCRGSAAARARRHADVSTHHELKCRACGAMNYLGTAQTP